MSAYLQLFLNNLLPIFLAAGAGYLLAEWLPIDPRTLSSLTFYIFSPCLVFTILTHTKLDSLEVIKVVALAMLLITILGIITWVTGKGLHLERTMMAATMICTMFMNAGNFGMPVTSFAFGEIALAYASIFFVTNNIMTYTAGVIIASLGKADLKKALTNLITLPTLYALILAIIFIRTGWNVPLPIERTTTLLGNAAIPTLMVLMGVQFHSIQLKGRILPLILTSSIRMLASPILALLLSVLAGLSGPARQAFILEAAMPSAVINTVLATQFDAEPQFVTAVVGATTILSIITLTPLLAFLGG